VTGDADEVVAPPDVDGAPGNRPAYQRPDYWRLFRFNVGRLVLLISTIFVVAAGYMVYDATARDHSRQPDHAAVFWVVLLLGVAGLVAASVFTVRAMFATDRSRSWRLLGWSLGLFAIGMAAIIGLAVTA
jgi:hypothetical protein